MNECGFRLQPEHQCWIEWRCSRPRATTVLFAQSRIPFGRFEIWDEDWDEVCGYECAVSRRTARIRHLQQIPSSKIPSSNALPTTNHQTKLRVQIHDSGLGFGFGLWLGGWALGVRWDLGFGSALGFGIWSLGFDLLIQAARLRLRSTARPSIPVPHADIASACGQSSSSPIPFRKMPRTITRK